MNRRRVFNPLPETFEVKRGPKTVVFKQTSLRGNEACYMDDFGEYHYFSVIKLRERFNLPEFVWEDENLT